MEVNSNQKKFSLGSKSKVTSQTTQKFQAYQLYILLISTVILLSIPDNLHISF